MFWFHHLFLHASFPITMSAVSRKKEISGAEEATLEPHELGQKHVHYAVKDV